MKSFTQHATRQVRQITEWLVWTLNIQTHTDMWKSWGRWLRGGLQWTTISGKASRSPVYLCVCISSEHCSFTVSFWVAALNLTPILWLLGQTPTVCRFHADTRGPSNRKPLTARLPHRPHLKEPPPLFRWTAVYITGYTDSQLTSSVCPLPLTPIWLSGIVRGDLTWFERGPAAEWIGRHMCYTRSVNDMEY